MKLITTIALLIFSISSFAQVSSNDVTQNTDTNHIKTESNERLEFIDVNERFILNGKEVEAVPIANGCGTQDGLGRFLGRTGAALDAAINTNPELLVLPFSIPSIATSAAAHALLNSDEYQRINNEICGERHDVPYHAGVPKLSTDYNIIEGGAYITGLAVILSSPLPVIGSNAAYEKAKKEAERSRQLEAELKAQGKMLSPGYFLRETNAASSSSHLEADHQEEGGHNLNAIVNMIFIFDDSVSKGEFIATEDDGFVYVRINPIDLTSISREFVEDISVLKHTNVDLNGYARAIRRREDVIPSTSRTERGLR